MDIRNLSDDELDNLINQAQGSKPSNDLSSLSDDDLDRLINQAQGSKPAVNTPASKPAATQSTPKPQTNTQSIAQPTNVLTGGVEVNVTNPNESKSQWRNTLRQGARKTGRALLAKPVENWFLGSKEDEQFLKDYNNSNVPTYAQITADLKAGKIDQAKAVDLINKRGKLDALSADAEYRNVRNTNIGKGAVELGTAAIGGGVGTAAAKVGVQALKQGGKQVAKQVLKNAGKVGAVGAGYGAAQGIVDENINPATEALKQAGIWGGTDLATLGAGKVIKNGANTKAGKAVGKAIGDAKDKINEKAFDIITSTEAGTKALQTLENAKNKIGEELVKPRTFKQAKQAKVNITPTVEETIAQNVDEVVPSQYGVSEDNSAINQQLADRMNNAVIAEQELLKEFNTKVATAKDKYGSIENLKAQAIKDMPQEEWGVTTQALKDYRELVQYERTLGEAKYVNPNAKSVVNGEYSGNVKNAVSGKKTLKQARAQKVAQKQVDTISPEPKTEVINESMIEGPGKPVEVETGINTPETNLTHVNEAPVGSNVEPMQKQRGGVKTLQKWFGKKNTENLTNTTYTTRPREVLKQEADALTDEARLNSINKVDGVTDTDLYVKAENIKNAFDNGQIPIKAMDNWLEVGTKKGQELQGLNALGDTPVNAALALHKGFKEGAPKAKALREQADKLIEAFYNKDQKTINEILRKAKIKTKHSKNLIDDLDILSENNMLTREEVENVINKRFGIGEVTNEDFKNLTAMYDNLNALDKNSYEYQLQESLIGKYIADRLPVSRAQKVKTLRNVFWLLNFKTAERNIFGNLAFNAVEKLVTDPTATLVDKVLSIQTGERSRVLPQLKEYMVGGVQGFKRSMKEVELGVNSRLKSGLQSFRDMGNRTFKNFSKQDIKQAKQNADTVLEGLVTEAKMKAENLAHNLEKALAYELQVPDRTFFEATYEESLRNQILAAGKKVTNEQIEEFRKIATEEALESVFQNNSRLANAMNDAKKFLNFKRELGIGDVSIPYVQTPANMAQQRINYSPVGLVHNLRKWKNRDITQRQASKAIARGLVGTAGYGAAGAGLVAGGVEINEKAKEYGKKYKTRKAMGKMDQSLEIKDGTINVNYSNIEPVTGAIETFNSYKNAYDKIKKYNYKKDIDEYKKAEGFGDKSKALLPMAKNTLDAVSPIVQTAIDPVMEMLDDSFAYKDLMERKSLPGVVDHVAGQAVRGLTPSIVRDFARATDKYERATKHPSEFVTALNEYRAAIPGARQTLEVRSNSAGQPEKTRGFANELLNPIKITKVSQDKILNAIDTLGEKDETFYLPYATNKVTFKQGEQEVSKELNTKQFNDYQRRLGQVALTVRANLLRNKDISKLSDLEKKDIAKQIQAADSAAKQLIASDMFGGDAPEPVYKTRKGPKFNKKKAGTIWGIEAIYNKVKLQEEKQASKEKRTRLNNRAKNK